MQSIYIRITSECGRSSKPKQTCNHTWRALTTLRFYPHLQGEITARNLNAWFKPQLISAAEVNTVAAERCARSVSRLTETRVQAARQSLRSGYRALAPRQPRAARSGRDSASLPRAHQVSLRPARPPQSAALAAQTQAEHQETRQPSTKRQKFHFHVERINCSLYRYLYIPIFLFVFI